MQTRDVFGKYGAEIQMSFNDARRSQTFRGFIELTKAGLSLDYEDGGRIVEWDGKQSGSGIGNFLLAFRRPVGDPEEKKFEEGFGSLHCFVGTKEHDVLSYHDQKMFEGRWEVKQPNGFIADSGYWCVQRDQFPADESVHIKFYIDKGFPPETKDL